jgi:endonuclease YncB( thermonuclease family)
VPAAYVVIGILILVTLAAGLPYLIASQDAQRPPSETVLTALTLPPGVALADLKEGRVYEVIDGDTIDVVIDGKLTRVRYFGVDTPERGDRCYREATDRNTTLIGSRVLLLPDGRDQDSFGRLLRYVFLPDGTSVDATLVAEGFASAWRDDGRYREQIIALEDQARAADRGCLWK